MGAIPAALVGGKAVVPAAPAAVSAPAAASAAVENQTQAPAAVSAPAAASAAGESQTQAPTMPPMAPIGPMGLGTPAPVSTAAPTAVVVDPMHANWSRVTTMAPPVVSDNDTQGGDLACMRWTGGTCRASECEPVRGSARCVEGRCLCSPGLCASSDGACEQKRGEWLGTHAIRFVNPEKTYQSYIGTKASQSWLGGLPGSSGTYLAAMGNTAPAWKVVAIDGLVRFESATWPGSVMTIYSNRRRSWRSSQLIQTNASKKEASGSGT